MPLNNSSISEIDIDDHGQSFQQTKSIEKEPMKKTLNQTGKESKTISRDEIYSCFCTKLNETFKSKGFIKMCINSFCGSPVYVIFSLFFLTITTIAAIVTLSLLNTQTSVAKINRSYFMNCSLNSDCDNLKGLQCSSQNVIVQQLKQRDIVIVV